jgi:hypothetical protein
MNTSRRAFLRSLGLGAGAFAISQTLRPRRARAAGAVDRNYVFAYFSGGWDILLGLDPRDPNVFTEDQIGTTKIQLAWDRIPKTYSPTIIQPAGSNIQFGPTMGGIAPYYNQLCVVRGMSMDTVTHEVGRRYFITGLPPRGLNAAGSAMGTRVVAQQGDQLPIPNLVSRVETYNENDPPFATGMSVSGVTDLVTALQDGAQAPTGAVRTRLDEYRAHATSCDPAALDKRGFLTLIQGTQLRARDLVTSGIAKKFKFNDGSGMDPEIAGIRSRYGITNTTTLLGPPGQAAMAYQALKHQIAQTVSIELAMSLDTHDNTWMTEQPDNQAAGWSALGVLVNDLATTAHPSGNGMLLDHTTVVVFSEFSRTALLNNREGRDHALCNACMLIGAGVPHNAVIGASSDHGLNPQPIDPMSGQVVSSGGTMISPTLVLASIMKSGGFDTERLRVDGLPCLAG